MPFSAFPDQSHTELCAIAAQDLLLADDTLSSWAGSRIERPPDPLMVPDLEMPYGLVAITDERQDPKLSQRNEVTFTILFTWVWEETRDKVGPDDRTAVSLFSHANRVLLQTDSARALQVERYSNQTLVDRVVGFGVVAYDAVAKPQPKHDADREPSALGIEPDDIIRFLTHGIEYAYRLDRTTWTKHGFTPP